MLDKCIKTISSDLNKYIKTRTGLNEDQVIYASYNDLATFQDKAPNPYTNKIIMSLVDIVHQETVQDPSTYVKRGNHYVVKNLPINFYIYLLFAAHFEGKHALEGLDYLSRVIAFFQFKNHFTSKNTPGLPSPELEGISATIVKLDHKQKSSLWTSLKTIYMPSVLYKIGMIPIEDMPEIWPTVPPIDAIYNAH